MQYQLACIARDSVDCGETPNGSGQISGRGPLATDLFVSEMHRNAGILNAA